MLLGGEPVELGVGQFAGRPALAVGGQRALPPVVQARRHAYTDLVLNRSRAAISPVASCCADIPAACTRTRSRPARPRAVSPPPSAYLIYAGVDPTQPEVTEARRA